MDLLVQGISAWKLQISSHIYHKLDCVNAFRSRAELRSVSLRSELHAWTDNVTAVSHSAWWAELSDVLVFMCFMWLYSRMLCACAAEKRLGCETVVEDQGFAMRCVVSSSWLRSWAFGSTAGDFDNAPTVSLDRFWWRSLLIVLLIKWLTCAQKLLNLI